MPHRCTQRKRHFSLKCITVMAHSKIGYQKWAIAIFLIQTSVRGISSTLTQLNIRDDAHRNDKSQEQPKNAEFNPLTRIIQAVYTLHETHNAPPVIKICDINQSTRWSCVCEFHAAWFSKRYNQTLCGPYHDDMYGVDLVILVVMTLYCVVSWWSTK